MDVYNKRGYGLMGNIRCQIQDISATVTHSLASNTLESLSAPLEEKSLLFLS